MKAPTKVLVAMRELAAEGQETPTFREIGARASVRSTSHVGLAVDILQANGLVRLERGAGGRIRFRSVRLTERGSAPVVVLD